MAPLARNTFNSNDRQYRCCLGCCHVRQSAIGLGVLLAVWLLANIIQVIVVYRDPAISAVFLSIVLALLVLYAILNTCMLYGTRTERPNFILPFLQYQGLSIVVSIGLVILCIISLANFNRKQGEVWHENLRTFAIVLLIELIFGIIFQAVMFYVVYKCYYFLRDKRNFLDNFDNRTHIQFTNHLVTLASSTPQAQYYNPTLISDHDDIANPVPPLNNINQY